MAYLVFFYAIFILIGGIVGHTKAGSTVSLMMGLIFGALLLVAAAAIRTRRRWGGYFALILTFLLDASFTWRFISTGKFNPPGILALVSLAVLITLAIHLQTVTKTPPRK
jgi:uncharacterized membrane protein (UPF0136 family)